MLPLPWPVFAIFIVAYAARFAYADDPEKYRVRFSNDYPKAVAFYVDGQLGCSVDANPEGNNAYCDAETGPGKHAATVKGEGLLQQSCEFFIVRKGSAYILLTKKGNINCSSLLSE